MSTGGVSTGSRHAARPDDSAGPRVGLFGRIGSGNLGNDGSLEALLPRIMGGRVAVDAMVSGPDVVTARYGISATRLHWNHAAGAVLPRPLALLRSTLRIPVGVVVDAVRIWRWVSGHDVVVVPGAGALEATLAIRPWQMPWSLFVLGLAGRRRGVRIAYVDVGVSTTPARLTGWLNASAARAATYRSYRDDASREAAASMGVDVSADEVFTDLVFAVEPPPAQPVPGSVGLGVVAFRGTAREASQGDAIAARYLAAVTGLALHLLDHDRSVRILIGDGDDIEIARTLADELRRLRPERASEVVFEPTDDLAGLQRQVARVEVVVGSRFHNVVAALSAGLPTLAIGYSRKHEDLMADLGVAPYTVPIREVDAGPLIALFEALDGDRDACRRKLGERLPSRRALVERQLDDIDALIAGPPTSERSDRADRADRAASTGATGAAR